MITLLLIIWIVLIIPAFNYYDYRVTRKGGKPEYKLYFIIKGALAIVHGALMLAVNQDSKTVYSDLTAWQLTVVWAPYLLFQITSFWIEYELIRNLWTRRQWDYYDSKEKDSGWIDRFFAWAGRPFHVFVKLCALAICVLSIIVIYQR